MSQTFTTNFAYDVFLSFRGEDTRYNFTGHLYDAFRRRGIETFFDDQNLRGGDELSPSLVTAIEESRMFVIVFSENYASSTWCLRELAEILQCAEKNNRRVWPIFYKVDPSDIRHQRRSYGDAMTKHEEKFGKDSERVSNWRSALTQVADLKGDHFQITGLEYLNVSGCKNLQEIHGIPSSLQAINAEGCTSLTLHSHNVLWSQAIKKKKSSDMIINMPGAQIPDWFDHRCKGRVLTFWARKKLSNATCAFVHNCRAGYILEGYQRLFINRVGVRNYSRRLWSPAYFVRGRPKVYFCDLEDALSEDVEKYLLQEWNYVEVVVVPSYGSSESCDCNMCECGIYVYKQGTRMEDVRFECPYITLPMELVLRNALKRGAAVHSENEPPKKLLKNHKPRDNGEKYQNPRTKERYPIG